MKVGNREMVGQDETRMCECHHITVDPLHYPHHVAITYLSVGRKCDQIVCVDKKKTLN